MRRQRAEDARNRVKPPSYPLVPPVAVRPADIAEKRQQAYVAEVEKWKTPPADRRQVTTSEFDRILGL